MKKNISSMHLHNEEHSLGKMVTQSNFRAFKDLVNAQNQVQAIKNRLKVLQANDLHNNSVITNQRDFIQRLQRVRKQHQYKQLQLHKSKEILEKNVEELKVRNKLAKNDHFQKINFIYDQIAQERARNYISSLERKDVNEEKITENKYKQLSQKQFRRNKVVEHLQESKQNYYSFLEMKASRILEKNKQQVADINRKKEKKEKELELLANMQIQLLKKQSESQVACQSYKSRLNNMLGISQRQQFKPKPKSNTNKFTKKIQSAYLAKIL